MLLVHLQALCTWERAQCSVFVGTVLWWRQVLVGLQAPDDAAVFRLPAEKGLVSTPVQFPGSPESLKMRVQPLVR